MSYEQSWNKSTDEKRVERERSLRRQMDDICPPRRRPSSSPQSAEPEPAPAAENLVSSGGNAAKISSAMDTLASRSDEYFAVMKVVSEYDARFITIKEWSVSLGVVAIAAAFTASHRSLFLVAALSALCFWLIEGLAKRHQQRYYRVMREIERAGDKRVFAPRVDWTWAKAGEKTYSETGLTTGRGPTSWYKPFIYPSVCLPHWLIAGVNIWLFFVVPSMAL